MPINATLSSDGWHVPPIVSVGGGAAVSAGTNIASTGTAVFSNSNGITFGMNTDGVVTASVGGTVAGGTANINLSAGTTSNAASAFTFSNGNDVSFGLNAGTLTASHGGARSTHSHGNPSLALTNLSGTTASASNGLTLSLAAAALALSAAGASASAGTMVFSNSNGVSFGAAGSTVTASHNGLTTAAQSNHSHGNPTLALTNLSGTTASNSAGLTLSLSAAAPGGAGGAAISAGGSSQNTGTVVFSNSNGVSFGMQDGVVTATVQPGAAAGIAAASAGTQQGTSGTLVFANSNGLTFGMSGSSQITASHNGITQQSTQPVAVSGANGSYAFSTLSLSNANGISFGTSAGSAITASHNALTTAALSNHSHGNPTLNLTNLSGTTASASNGLTLSLSAAAQSNQSLGVYAVSNTTQSSSGTVDARTMSIRAHGLVSAGFSNGSVVISAPDTTSFNPLSVGFSTNGNTAGDTGFGTDRVVFVGGANVTLSGSTNGGSQTITISGAAGAAIGISAGTQSVATGTPVFSNSNGISFGMSGSSRITASFALSNQVVSAYAVSNTTQSTTGTVNVSAVSFHGAGGVSVGVSNGSVVISGGAGGAGYTAGLSNIGNTAGDTGAVTGRLVLAGGNNVTLSGSTNAGSMTVTVSAAAQTNQSVGLYAVGNTTQNSSTTLDARTISFNALGAMTAGYSNGSVQLSAPATSSLSATGLLSIATNGSTISLGVPGDTLSRYEYPPSRNMQMSSSQQANGSYTLQHISVLQPISFTRVDVRLLFSLASAANTNTAAIAITRLAALYTRNNVTLSPVAGASGSQTLSWASNTHNFDSLTGGRNFSFAMNGNLTPGEYWLGFHLSTASAISTGANTTALDGTLSVMAGSLYTASAFGEIGALVAGSSNTGIYGVISSAVSNTSQTLQLSQVTMTGTAAFRANVPVMFRNY